MEWNVYYENFNGRRIEKFNVFHHGRFFDDLKKNAKKNKNDKDAFAEQIRKDVAYYYWSKCEWEIVLTSWPPREQFEKKIDVYEQLKLNWNQFIDYCWNHIDELLGKTVEILTGTDFGQVIKDLNIESAEREFKGNKYAVWRLHKKDLKKLDKIPEEQWKDNWSWWRFSEGSIFDDSPTYYFNVNGHFFIGFEKSDFVPEDSNSEYQKMKEYENLSDYLCNCIGATAEKNVCALLISLAKKNYMSMAELLETYGE